MDLRRILFSQIVLSGGTTLFPGFGDRLLSEVKTHSNSPKNTKIRITAPTERLSSVWIGESQQSLTIFFAIRFVLILYCVRTFVLFYVSLTSWIFPCPEHEPFLFLTLLTKFALDPHKIVMN